MKLSKRLKIIEQMVESGYEHIWDCCCDHGLLGASLLAKQAAKNIHFVDTVPGLINKIEHKLQQFHSNSPSKWITHCLDAAELPLQQYQGKQLIIIAGIGGDLMSRMINGICNRNPPLNADFLLCPVHRQFALRKQLIELNFSLKDEVLIEDNQKLYEILLVSSIIDETLPINPIGSKIWYSDTSKQTDIAKKHLENTLNYYYRIKLGDNLAEIDSIIKAYSAVLIIE